MFLKKEINLLIIVLLITGILRFFNLMHDSPYFFNPDERNMANAISQFRLPAKLTEIPICLISQISPLRNDPGSSSGSNDPGSSTTNDCNLNPHFFAYGQFPLYLAFASDQTIKSFWQVPVLVGTRPESDPGQARMTSFPSAIFWLRFWSALSSVLTIVLVYLITQKLLINNLNSSHSGKRGTSASRISIGFWASQNDNPGLNIGHYAAILAAFSPGLIQSAHFGTTESLLTFFFMASVYISLRYLSDLSRLRFILFSSLVIGLATGSKLTGIFFFIPPLTVLMIKIIQILKKQKKNWFFVTLFHCSIVSLLIIGSIIIFILSSPYNLVEPESFKSAVFGYEGDVAMGKYEAFYTRQFVNTTPVIFQAEKIFPYALGWPVFILGSIGILLITVKLLSMLILSILRKAQSSKLKAQIKKVQFWDFENWGLFGILIFGFWIYFIPNAFLFAKWTRFMTPILPFFAIFAGYFLFVILGSVSDSRIDPRAKSRDSGHLPADATHQALQAGARMTIKFVYWFICLLVPLSGIMPGLMFMSIYTHEDSRVSASKWIYNNISNNSYVLSETANVVDIPLGLPNNETMKQWSNAQVISFDFYHMDENPMIFNDLLGHLQKANYIFIPSRRIFANYTKLPQKYPLATKYYQLLFSGALGFDKINETSSFPQLPIINYLPAMLAQALQAGQLPDENAEETSTVFDHPVVRIYKKTHPFTIDEYRLLFNKN